MFALLFGGFSEKPEARYASLPSFTEEYAFSLEKDKKGYRSVSTTLTANYRYATRRKSVKAQVSKKHISELRFYDLPQTYKWICDWNINVDGKDVKTIQTVEQHFFYDRIDVVNEIATTTVSKFNCSVSRSTEKNNKHVFINQSK